MVAAEPPVVVALAAPEAFPLLERECAAAQARATTPLVASFCLPRPGASEPRTERCTLCCHWSLPLHLPDRQRYPFLIARSYEEWVVWHLHVVTHQHLEPSAQVA